MIHKQSIAHTLLLTLVLATTNVPAQSADTVTFETIPDGSPTDGLSISTQFLADYGITFSLEGGGSPVLAQVGEPRTAFQGYNLLADQPAPGANAGSFFLTDDGVVGGPPAPLIISYATPVAAASGVLLDIDATEAWQIQARDASDNVIDTIDLGPNNDLDGSATLWSFDRPDADIHSIRMVFTGFNVLVGLAFDNFSPAAPTSLFCSSPGVTIPDNTPGGVNDVLPIPDPGSVIDVSVSLNISHPFIGNLVANLTNNTTGTSIELINSPGSQAVSGGCPLPNIDAAFDDEASELTDIACDNMGPALGGSWKPNEALSVFENSDFTGDWTLQVIDTAASNVGTLNQWCLDIVAGPPIVDTDDDGINDNLDNCKSDANPLQVDSNGDGIGNVCDADIAGEAGAGADDCTVNFFDLGQMKSVFFSTDADADLVGEADSEPDGTVNFFDLGRMKELFFTTPGPSGLPNACD